MPSIVIAAPPPSSSASRRIPVSVLVVIGVAASAAPICVVAAGQLDVKHVATFMAAALPLAALGIGLGAAVLRPSPVATPAGIDAPDADPSTPTSAPAASPESAAAPRILQDPAGVTSDAESPASPVTPEAPPSEEAAIRSDPIPAQATLPGPRGAATRASIVVRLADSPRAHRLAGSLSAAGYNAVAAETTDELHSLLNRDRVDLLVIEDALPGFLSGLDVVEMFRRELIRPLVVLLADNRKDPRVRELRPASALPSAADLPDIAAAVRTALTQADQVAFVSPAARTLVAAHRGLRPMPQLLVRLASYLATDAAEVSIPDLARDVSSDPAAAAELLRVTNSSALGLRRRVTSVSDAVTLLGPRKTIALVISGAAVASANELLRNWAPPLKAWYHRRSILSAAAAQAFARFEKVSPDTAFLLGLLQDLGIVVQADTAAERYARTVERSWKVPQLTLPLVERVELGFTHADVSAALLQRWGLPASLVGPVLLHHADDAPLPKTERTFVRLMRIGEAVADLADHPCPQRRQTLNRLLSACPGATPAAALAAVGESVSRAVEASRMFAIPEPDPETLRRLDAELRSPPGE